MKKIIIILGIVLSIISIPAVANPGFYIQGQGGFVAIIPGGSDFESDLFDLSDGGTGRLSGGYLWGDNNLNYGLETGVMIYPNARSSDSFLNLFDTKYEGFNLDLLGVLKYTFNCGFNVFAKAGLAYMHQHVTTDSINFTLFDAVNVPSVQLADNTGNKIAPEIAAGIGYQFNPNFEINLALMSAITGSTSPVAANPVATTSSVMLGLAYHFG